MENKITQEDIKKLLDNCYQKCLNGIPKVSPSVDELVEEYLKKHETRESAAKAFIRNQLVKCTMSGFLSGFGGVITLPVSVPANIANVLYVQLRMISCLAIMGGNSSTSDQTQTFVYACLAGVSVNKILKDVGMKIGVKLTNSMIKKIPGKALTKINQKVGLRLVTKFGTKGVINLGKAVPVVVSLQYFLLWILDLY